MPEPQLTFIVRVRDDRAGLLGALDSIAAQDVPAAVVVVDSGSTDGSLEVARERADAVVEIARYSHGAALNRGIEAATTPICAALSAHSRLAGPDWVRRATAHFDRPEVGAVHGTLDAPGGGVLTAPVDQTADGPPERPNWGLSNHAAAWRTAVCRRFPFDETLETAEDKRWSATVRSAGWTLVFDPALHVTTDHRGDGGLLALYRRARTEARVLAREGIGRPLSGREAVALWWAAPHARRPRAIERLNYGRAVEIAAWWRGGRRGRADRRPPG